MTAAYTDGVLAKWLAVGSIVPRSGKAASFNVAKERGIASVSRTGPLINRQLEKSAGDLDVGIFDLDRLLISCFISSNHRIDSIHANNKRNYHECEGRGAGEGGLERY